MGNIVEFLRPEDKEVTEFVKNSDYMVLKFDEDGEQVQVMTNIKLSLNKLVLAHVAYLAISDFMRIENE